MYQHFIIPYLYETQHVSGNTSPIIRNLNLHWQPLVFYTWKVFGRVAGGRCPPATRPTTFHVWKTRGCQCSFRFLMMGGVSSETCWASYKYEINFDTLLHIVGFLYELYYDARIHGHHVHATSVTINHQDDENSAHGINNSVLNLTN